MDTRKAAHLIELLPSDLGDLRQDRCQIGRIHGAPRRRPAIARSNFGPNLRWYLKKTLHYLWIELRTGKLADLRTGVFVAPCLAIGPVGSQDVEAVRHRETSNPH